MALGQKAKEFNFAKIPNVFTLNSLSLTSKSGNDLKRDLIKELEFRIQNLKSDIEDEKEKLMNQYT